MPAVIEFGVVDGTFGRHHTADEEPTLAASGWNVRKILYVDGRYLFFASRYGCMRHPMARRRDFERGRTRFLACIHDDLCRAAFHVNGSKRRVVVCKEEREIVAGFRTACLAFLWLLASAIEHRRRLFRVVLGVAFSRTQALAVTHCPRLLRAQRHEQRMPIRGPMSLIACKQTRPNHGIAHP